MDGGGGEKTNTISPHKQQTTGRGLETLTLSILWRRLAKQSWRERECGGKGEQGGQSQIPVGL
jgi:hypothetical protein